MDELMRRFEQVTLDVGRLLDRETLVNKMIAQQVEEKQLALQRQRFNDVLDRYKALQSIGVELDFCAKDEIRQFVSTMTRDDIDSENKRSISNIVLPHRLKWMNGRPMYDNCSS